MATHVDSLFARIDSNGDNLIQREEFLNFYLSPLSE